MKLICCIVCHDGSCSRLASGVRPCLIFPPPTCRIVEAHDSAPHKQFSQSSLQPPSTPEQISVCHVWRCMMYESGLLRASSQQFQPWLPIFRQKNTEIFRWYTTGFRWRSDIRVVCSSFCSYGLWEASCAPTLSQAGTSAISLGSHSAPKRFSSVLLFDSGARSCGLGSRSAEMPSERLRC